jgi:hypothetical protein
VEGPPLSLSIPLDAATNKGELEDYKVADLISSFQSNVSLQTYFLRQSRRPVDIDIVSLQALQRCLQHIDQEGCQLGALLAEWDLLHSAYL